MVVMGTYQNEWLLKCICWSALNFKIPCDLWCNQCRWGACPVGLLGSVPAKSLVQIWVAPCRAFSSMMGVRILWRLFHPCPFLGLKLPLLASIPPSFSSYGAQHSHRYTALVGQYKFSNLCYLHMSHRKVLSSYFTMAGTAPMLVKNRGVLSERLAGYRLVFRDKWPNQI